MSLNQAFQTAVAYRQGMIEQNQAAAAQAPMLAIQALGVGLQAQAQSQRAQFEMQSMVLQTQLQIEETKAKQAMQVMEFDFAQRKFAADQQQAKMDFDLRKQALGANLEANAIRVQQTKNEMATARNNQLADTFIGSQFARGVTEEQLLTGTNPEGLEEFVKTYPEAGAVLGSRLNAARTATKSTLSGQIAELSLARDKAIFDAKATPGARVLAEQYFGKQIQPLEDRLAALEGRPAQNLSDTGIRSKLAAFGTANTLDVKTRIDLMDAARKEADLGTPEGMARAERLYAEAEGAMPETNPKDPVGDELNAPVTPKIEWGGDPEAAVRNAKQGVATEAWNSFEKTKVAEGIMPVLTAARSQAAAAGDTARVAEVDRLKLALDASKAATLRGITGSDFWRSSGPVERGLTAEEARDRFMTAYRFQPEVPRIGGMSQRQMEAFPAKPTYAQVKELLESLEVKR
jgi:hypothetical protein